ncbi:TonB-dependent receptor [candidate division KSB1 bacterium]|nr:TonB-dependent receptor [candidate division KSB1 bacterium]
MTVNKKQILIVVFSIYGFGLFAGEAVLVTGRVTDPKGRPLEYVNVYFPDDLSGDVTDGEGNFQIKTRDTGRRTLMVTCIGYENSNLSVNIGRENPDLHITLQQKTIEMQPVSVQASSFSIAEDEGVTLNALDVVTTAGAAADVMRAVQTFSGVNTMDDGAGIFVRGGDVHETKVLLDNGHLKHPYKYESPTGGYFGTFSPFLLSGTFFSSGGFSAQYGNALSGVLAMESLDMPAKRELSLGIGLAALSAGGSFGLIDDRLGIHFSGNKSQTRQLFKLNGGLHEFSRPPVSDDINLSVIYRYHRNGTIKAFAFLSVEQIGVEAITPNFRDYYYGNEKNRFYFLKWRHMLTSSVLLTGTVSDNQFRNNQSLSALELKTDDRLHNSRLDADITVNSQISLKTGLEHQRLKTDYHGTVPFDPNDIQGIGKMLHFDDATNADISGAYAEAEVQLGKGFAVNYGQRIGYRHQSGAWTHDPRLSVVYGFQTDHALRLATGRYHQFPETFYYDSDNGNPDLRPMQAFHYIAGWEWKPPAMMMRIEGYVKTYNDLLLQEYSGGYSNGGHGYARGVDVFVKRNMGFISGWSSYSFLQSKRKEFLYHQPVPTDYDITHHFKIAAKFNISPVFNLSTSYRFASGRPFHSGFGRWNTQRGPAYEKLDISASYLLSFFTDNLTIFYISVSNVLGNENITAYTYSPDYNEVYKRTSVYKRSVYFGLTFNF